MRKNNLRFAISFYIIDKYQLTVGTDIIWFPTPLSWTDAQTSCLDQGMDLASIDGRMATNKVDYNDEIQVGIESWIGLYRHGTLRVGTPGMWYVCSGKLT